MALHSIHTPWNMLNIRDAPRTTHVGGARGVGRICENCKYYQYPQYPGGEKGAPRTRPLFLFIVARVIFFAKCVFPKEHFFGQEKLHFYSRFAKNLVTNCEATILPG